MARALDRSDRSPLGWLGERHSFGVELAVVAGCYVLYETGRGLVAGDRPGAVHHARTIASLERSLHIFAEGDVQRAAHDLPGLIGTLGVLYLTLHLAVTGGCLIWLHRRRPTVFPLVRTTLLIASGLAVIGYLGFPTAPPRLAIAGIADTISDSQVDLNHGLVSFLYNPFAAFPSVHIAYAVVVGATLVRHGGNRLAQVAGALYPALILLVIVATGNHFFLDAVAGAAVAAAAFATTAVALAPKVRVGLAAPADA